MFKKTLAAIAVLGAFSAGAMAAEVQLYGIVDYGMIYSNQDMDLTLSSTASNEGTEKADMSNKIDGLELNSGVNSGSRWGLRGSEDLGNGYMVSFKLESGFDADDGRLGQNSRLFGREASLTLSSEWGSLSTGRMGALGSAAGSYDTVFAIGDAFDGGDNALFSAATTDRYDNMLTYQSHTFAGGIQLTAQYSFKTDNKRDWSEMDDEFGEQLEGHDSAERYAGIALTGKYGAFEGVAAYEQVFRSAAIPFYFDDDMPKATVPDQKIFSLGGNYDFNTFRLFAMAQYYEGANLSSVGLSNFRANLGEVMPSVAGLYDQYEEISGHQAEGYSLHIGAQMPLFAGTLTTGIYYTDADLLTAWTDSLNKYWDKTDYSLEEVALSVKYEYPLSARTTLYSAVGYAYSEIDMTTRMCDSSDPSNWNGKLAYEVEANTTQAYIGITHRF